MSWSWNSIHGPASSAAAFKRKDFVFEAGLHMTGMPEKGDEEYAFYRECGLLEKLDFVPVPEFYYIKGRDFDFVFGNDIRDNIRRLKAMFPGEKAGIDTYFRSIFRLQEQALRVNGKKGLSRSLNILISPLRYPKLIRAMLTDTGSFLDRIFHDERIKIILLANIGYYGDDPYALSFLFFAIAQAGFYRKGGSYIRGGSHQLPEGLTEHIRTRGGALLTSAQVIRIITRNGKAAGVEYISKGRKGTAAEYRKAFAPVIIANAAIPNVVNEMLDPKSAAPLKRKYRDMIPGNSIMTVYIATDKPLREMGNRHYSSNFYDSKTFTLSEMGKLHGADFDERPFILCDYSQIDAGLAPPGKGYAVLSLMDYLRDWEGLSEEEYRRKKKRAVGMLIDRLREKFPGLREHIIHVEAATARTMKRYLQTPEGTAYGYAQTPRQAILFRPGVRSPLKNLYFASAWTLPGGGFGGAMGSGHLCAKKIRKDLKNR
ncbi:MAG: NAD(P)/FAD-dependent oxidoreductase [Candidatus Marinimicrobia bacterium]|nr:NAD(P)/FAD-dependent oxidoreductase [Candidatus Neomarinimicrobiota bacterium]